MTPRRPGLRTRFRSTVLLTGSLVTLLFLVGPVWLGRPAAQAAGTRAGGVSIRVVSVSPADPDRSAAERPLVVTLELTNTTGSALSNVRVAGRRGDPVTTQATLDGLLADSTPQPAGRDITTKKPVTIDLPADGIGHTVVFRSTYGVPSDSGVCQCADGVYPLYFTAERVTASGVARRLDTAVTLLPSFLNKPKPVRVAWVWPLIDRPHRLTANATFLDDSLATEVTDGGRLDRSLAAVEQVADTVPVTLVADPELLDELEVMATRTYTVRAAGNLPAVTGTGKDAAVAWLDRLDRLLRSHPGVRIAFTPYADPDIPSLSLSGLGWSNQMPVDMTARVEQTLGGRSLDYSLAWPASGAYTTKAFDSLLRYGVTSAVLPTTAISPRDGADSGVASGTARVTRGSNSVSVGLLSTSMQADVAATVTSDGSDARLSQLLGEIAVRAVAQPDTSHTVVLTPPRWVDPDPTRAVAAIRATSTSPFTQPISLSNALDGDRLPATRSRLASFRSATPTLSAHIISPVSAVDSKLPVITSMLAGSGTTADTLVSSYPVALQRATSSYWLAHPGAGAAFAERLRTQIEMITNGDYVHIVRPSSGSYTLASNNSPLPVTIRNRLPYPVHVRVQVATDNGLPGFRVPGPDKVLTIPARSRSTLRLPTVIERTGRIQIEAKLLAPKGDAIIGDAVSLTVHSTALGVVGVVITVVAGGVLALALLLRLGRRLLQPRRRRAAKPTGRPRASAEPAA